LKPRRNAAQARSRLTRMVLALAMFEVLPFAHFKPEQEITINKYAPPPLSLVFSRRISLSDFDLRLPITKGKPCTKFGARLPTRQAIHLPKIIPK